MSIDIVVLLIQLMFMEVISMKFWKYLIAFLIYYRQMELYKDSTSSSGYNTRSTLLPNIASEKLEY